MKKILLALLLLLAPIVQADSIRGIASVKSLHHRAPFIQNEWPMGLTVQYDFERWDSVVPHVSAGFFKNSPGEWTGYLEQGIGYQFDFGDWQIEPQYNLMQNYGYRNNNGKRYLNAIHYPSVAVRYKKFGVRYLNLQSGLSVLQLEWKF